MTHCLSFPFDYRFYQGSDTLIAHSLLFEPRSEIHNRFLAEVSSRMAQGCVGDVYEADWEDDGNDPFSDRDKEDGYSLRHAMPSSIFELLCDEIATLHSTEVTILSKKSTALPSRHRLTDRVSCFQRILHLLPWSGHSSTSLVRALSHTTGECSAVRFFLRQLNTLTIQQEKYYEERGFRDDDSDDPVFILLEHAMELCSNILTHLSGQGPRVRCFVVHFPPPCSVSPPLPSTTEDIESSSPSLPPSKIPTLIAVSHPRRFMCREIGVAAAELGGVMWPSALSLTRRMVCGGGFYDVFQHVRRAARSVLELGCGVFPLPSMSAMTLLLDQSVASEDVCESVSFTITDGKRELLEVAAQCVQRNVSRALLQCKGGSVCIGNLDWNHLNAVMSSPSSSCSESRHCGDLQTSPLPPAPSLPISHSLSLEEDSFDIILGADILYNYDNALPIKKAIERLLRKTPSSRAFLCSGPPDSRYSLEQFLQLFGCAISCTDTSYTVSQPPAPMKSTLDEPSLALLHHEQMGRGEEWTLNMVIGWR